MLLVFTSSGPGLYIGVVVTLKDLLVNRTRLDKIANVFDFSVVRGPSRTTIFGIDGSEFGQ
jgi:hypothetical protein